MYPKADAYSALPFHVSSTVLVSVPNMETEAYKAAYSDFV
jgi:hypothetical protein